MLRLFKPLGVLLIAAALIPVPLGAAPSWIWLSGEARDGEAVDFRTAFDVDGEVDSALLRVSCDNAAVVLLNGEKVAEANDWESPVRVSVTDKLKPGRNMLVVQARNRDGRAGLLFTLRIRSADGETRRIESGGDWEAAASGSETWKKARVIAEYGADPWGEVFDRRRGSRDGGDASATENLVTLPDFRAELLYTVPRAEQGSWVSMTVEPDGKLVVCDQYGGLYRVTPPPVGSEGETRVEPIEAAVGGAHGLLYAFDSLYVMVNEQSDKGLWRLRDGDGDGSYEAAHHLREINGGGEHGPHGIVMGPDERSLFFVNGNHTQLPTDMERSRAVRRWGEDHILPRMWDARGHAKGVLAPGGYICKTDPEGKIVELYTNGFRNAYDIAFDQNGELFTFDSDMEWDLGTPWYRPTRVNHCVSGAEFGWRSGSGKWPDYYPDMLPPVVDIGPGSPTGVAMGTGAAFPAKYQRALFINDWTYGTMYAVHLFPDGASFRAEVEEFVSGKPLPLTDLLVHPQDGSLYFAIGGRRTQSALYRIVYEWNKSTEPAAALPPTERAKQRRALEALHEEGTGPEAIEKAWPFLSHPDRHLRFAARVAIERQPVDRWAERAMNEENDQARIEAAVALARVGSESHQPGLLQALGEIDFTTLKKMQKLGLLRAYQLGFIRLGQPSDEVRASVAARLEPRYPAEENEVNRELCQLLVYLGSKQVVAKTLALMATAKDDHRPVANEALLERNTGYAQAARAVHGSRPNQQQFALMFTLRHATEGWTPELRRAYFSWFPRTQAWQGGNSFKGFLENARQEALANFVPEDEKAALEELSKLETPSALASFTPPRGPGQNYTVEDVVALTEGGLKGRDFERGKNLFGALACLACHRFAGEGGSIGPDVTGSGNRYTMHDLAENLIEPSKVISDQYDSHQLKMRDGSTVIGRIVEEKDGQILVMTNPFAPDQLAAFPAEDLESQQTWGVSMMPPGLINALNEEELKDLLAYILSAGNPQDDAFAD